MGISIHVWYIYLVHYRRRPRSLGVAYAKTRRWPRCTRVEQRRGEQEQLHEGGIGVWVRRRRREQSDGRESKGESDGSSDSEERKANTTRGIARSRFRDLQRPHHPRCEALGRDAARDGSEPEERRAVAEVVDALDGFCFLGLALARGRDAAIAPDVRALDAIAQGGFEHGELKIGRGQAECAVERVEDVADGDVWRGPERAGGGDDDDRPWEIFADDGERWEWRLGSGLAHERIGEPGGWGE